MSVLVRTYYGTENLGDALQTYALCRLLPNALAWSKTIAGTRPFVVNGWLGHRPIVKSANALFAGVFVCPRTPRYFDWLAEHPPIGARDPHTQNRLLGRGICSELIGCATLTLPRYYGPRVGTLHIDDDTPGCLTNRISRDMPWSEQWAQAKSRIDLVRRAALVHTRRLHIVLPCLALGTPVIWRRGGNDSARRFSVLAAMGLVEGDTASIDCTPWAERYCRFLEQHLNVRIGEHEPTLPIETRWSTKTVTSAILPKRQPDGRGISSENVRITAVLLNWKRAENLLSIVAALKACPAVGEIIVWNNNPEAPLQLPDVTVINSSVNRGCDARFIAASLARCPVILTQDDDLVLPSDTICTLLSRYQEQPDCLHGLFGRSVGKRGKYRPQNVHGAVKILAGRVIMFSKELLPEFFKLAALPEIAQTREQHGRIDFDEDILFSYAVHWHSGKPNRAWPLPHQNLPAPHAVSALPNHRAARNALVSKLREIEFEREATQPGTQDR